MKPDKLYCAHDQLTFGVSGSTSSVQFVRCERGLRVRVRFSLRSGLLDTLQVCRGYDDPHGDPSGYGDRNSIPTAALILCDVVLLGGLWSAEFDDDNGSKSL